MPYTEVKAEICRIILRSRRDEESFNLDSCKAADNIILYMQAEGLISIGKVIKLSEMQFKESANY